MTVPIHEVQKIRVMDGNISTTQIYSHLVSSELHEVEFTSPVALWQGRFLPRRGCMTNTNIHGNFPLPIRLSFLDTDKLPVRRWRAVLPGFPEFPRTGAQPHIARRGDPDIRGIP